MKDLLYRYINDFDNADVNWQLALAYDAIGQTGSALSFYLRAAERATDDVMQYQSLLKCALCFERQRFRDLTVKTILNKAVALMPRRPEAYFLLSRWGEYTKNWQDCYTVATVALEICDFDLPPLNADVQYHGKYTLIFQRAMSAWWIGHVDESRELMAYLHTSVDMHPIFKQAVISNINSIGWPYTVVEYRRNLLPKFRFKFDGIQRIEKNCSQSCQDMFVLAVHDGKEDGTYLEIGSAEPYKSNNTALLEQNFNWRGVSIDINQSLIDEFRRTRRNPAVCADATKIDYAQLIQSHGLPQDIDYLQVDCDPPETSLEILKLMPFDTHRFAVITFEHDFYTNLKVKDESRKFLQEKGYILLAGDIAYNRTNSYEDWWVHPELVPGDIVKRMQDTRDGVKFVQDYMFG